MSDPSDPSADPPGDLPEPTNLKFLRRLVTVLTATMIAGIVLILALIVIRYSDSRAPLPEAITLPSGVTATAFTQGDDWYAVVTRDNEILIFDRATHRLRQTITIRAE